MSKRLILMRHAKSSWHSPAPEDHARPLNGRGRVSSRAVGEWLRAKKFLPDQVLSSSATRTRETFAGLGLFCDAAFTDALYHAGAAEMLQVLRGARGGCVLVLGHNPGIAEFAHDMVARAPDHPRFADFPTAATLVADFPISDWPDLAPGTGQPVDFVIPRELTG